jgi:hypothetical protein
VLKCQLLELGFDDGREVLCEFIQVGMPEGVEWPYCNSKQSYRRKVQQATEFGELIAVKACGVVGGVVFLGKRNTFEEHNSWTPSGGSRPRSNR